MYLENLERKGRYNHSHTKNMTMTLIQHNNKVIRITKRTRIKHIWLYFLILLKNKNFILVKAYLAVLKTAVGSCSIVSKPLYYHGDNTGVISLAAHLIRSFHPSKVRKGVPDNTGAKIGSSTMRGQRIKHHWWYNLWLSTYVPGSVERIQIDKSQRSITMCYFVRYIQVQFWH